jgi:soluble lytic murein transglycosylase-like protein
VDAEDLKFMFSAPSVQWLAALVLLTANGAAAQSSGTHAPSAVDSAWSSAQQAIQQQLTSIDKQRQSIHQQLGEALDANGIRVADFIEPWPALLPAHCPALGGDDINALTTQAAHEQALSADLLRAVIKQESAFRPCAVSIRGAQGLMQLMPATAQQFRVADPFDPSQNVRAGAAYLKQLLIRYKGDLTLALAAYNAGPLRADQQANRPFPVETQNYLLTILADLGMGQPIPSGVEPSETAGLGVSHPAEPPKPVPPVPNF